MVNRKKRLARGIESLKRRLDEHKIKLERAKKDNKIELIDYYEKELENFEIYREKKKKILEK
ncbi:hypothetical protein J4404_02340 [Candidatus Woesearchaeota archaeon]|nr:hypothetical protein [Candidatus Woesearchaeota archaeon]